MSIRVTVNELREQLPEVIGHAVESDEAYIIQRDGQDCAVLVSAREWERRTQDRAALRRLPRHRPNFNADDALLGNSSTLSIRSIGSRRKSKPG